VRQQALPEHVVTLGELEQMAGNTARARELLDEQRRTMSRTGSNEDTGLALLEADHGDPERALRIARRGFRRAPSVHSADALGWAHTRPGDAAAGLRWGRRALRLGSRDPLFLAHAGFSAAGGRKEDGRPSAAAARRRRRRAALPHVGPARACCAAPPRPGVTARRHGQRPPVPIAYP
jgi:hypothetical protein